MLLKSLKGNSFGQKSQKTSKQPWRTEKICWFDSTRTIRECRGFKEEHQCNRKWNLCALNCSCLKNCKQTKLFCWRFIYTTLIQRIWSIKLHPIGTIGYGGVNFNSKLIGENHKYCLDNVWYLNLHNFYTKVLFWEIKLTNNYLKFRIIWSYIFKYMHRHSRLWGNS